MLSKVNLYSENKKTTTKKQKKPRKNHKTEVEIVVKEANITG